MLRDRVAPGLRDLGFTGSGKSFTFRADRNSADHALLGVQGWRYNDAAVARFTLNAYFYSAEDWSRAQESTRRRGMTPKAKPSPNVEYFCGWKDRIGYLSEPGHDHWWAVRDDAEAELVAADVIHQVKAYAVPQLAARLDRRQPPPTFSDGSDGPCKWPLCWHNDDDDWD